MKKLKKSHFNTIILYLCLAPLIISWGTFGHEHINHAAVFALPPSMRTFFYNHIDFITQESTVPDLRKYTLNDKTENPRHFIDIENYGSIDSIPKSDESVKKKFDEKFLSKNGTLPWYMQSMMDKLTKAFKEKRKTEILFLAADLGHYIGDAYMPLHTTSNYDGQETNQKGIHSFWEAHLPELFGKGYSYNVGDAVYIEDLREEIWKIIILSHQLIDTLLITEKKLREIYPSDKVYLQDTGGLVLKNKFNQPIHSLEYAKQYHVLLNGMVEKQLLKAIKTTANFWYTAWVNAGKPDLATLDPAKLSKDNENSLKSDIKLFKQGKLKDLESEKEF